MRLFLGTAIPLPHATELRERIAPLLATTNWREAPVEQWHVTALFIGDRPDVALPIIRQAAAHLASSTPPITLAKGRLVTMPKDVPSMLWIRFQPAPALTALHMGLAARTGTEPSIYRPYWPHITLARARKNNVEVLDGEVLVERLTLNELTLFHSTRGPNGSVHQPLESWPFTGTDPAAHVAVP